MEHQSQIKLIRNKRIVKVVLLANVLFCPLNTLLLARKLLDSQQKYFLLVFFLMNSVKLSIKSFKVPELYVEVPETATFGSLKVYNYLEVHLLFLSCI